MKKYFAEMLGTMILVLMGCGVAVSLNGSSVCDLVTANAATVIGTSLAFGLSVVAMAYAIGGISGCHINPAITFVLVVLGTTDSEKGAGNFAGLSEYMRKYICMAIVAVTMSACNHQATFSISGNVDGAEKVYLLDSKRNVIDSVSVGNGSFVIERTYIEPKRCYISDNRDIQSADYAAFVFVEQGEITIKGDEEGLYASGTPSNDAYHDLVKAQAALENEYYADSTTDERRKQIDDEYDASVRNAVEQNYDNIFGLYELTDLMYDLDGESSMTYLSRFSEEMQNTDTWKLMMQDTQDKMRVDVGNPYIDFTQNAPDGTGISLKSVVEKEGNRYVLLDFWASWCRPCMGEVPYLLKDYAEYHSKGFEIFGSSLDRDKTKWTGAIEENNMDWVHVSDLKYWDNSAAALYAVRSIPANFLIDCSNGKIVARNLRGENLGLKLSELLDGVTLTAL